MKHLSYNEFTKLMENKGETTVVTNECIYTFTGISEHNVCVQIAFKLNELNQIGETGFYVRFDRVVTTTEAQCMYMSL